VSFKIQVSQPAVTDDSYLRTDVKPPKLGKGALQYIYIHIHVSFICALCALRMRPLHRLRHLRDHCCTCRTIVRAIAPLFLCSFFQSQKMYDLDFRSKFVLREEFLLIWNPSRQILVVPVKRLLNAIVCLTFESRDRSFLLIFFVSLVS